VGQTKQASDLNHRKQSLVKTNKYKKTFSDERYQNHV